MLDQFHVAFGSVPGRTHIEQSINNQDAVWGTATNEIIVAIVCDGCSGGNLNFTPDSEIGAKLQAQVIGRTLAEHTPQFGVGPALEMARSRWMQTISSIAGALQEDTQTVVTRMMLATLIGVVVTPHTTTLFRKGDGVYLFQGQTPVSIDEDDAPDYPAYGLFQGLDHDPQFCVEKLTPTDDLQGLIFGSDGLNVFIDTPGRPAHGDKPIGPLDQFFGPLFLQGEKLIQRRLTACGPWRGRYPNKNPLYDDTSLFRIQRKL